jgi:hypothetical protein
VSLLARRYGASPAHLLAHLILLPLAAWALLQVFRVPSTGRILLWLAGSVIAHDLLLLPFYSLLDRIAERAAPRRGVNYVRVPAGLALLLGLVYLPQIGGGGDPAYARVAGRHFDAPLERWLLASAALFAVAGVVYLVRGGSKS